MRALTVALLALSALAGPARAQGAAHPDSLLAGEIRLRVEIDQSARRLPLQDPVLGSNAIAMLRAVDSLNTEWLRAVVARRGWPAISQVGTEASGGAWLLVQHADRDPAFQRAMLALMEPLVASGEVSGSNVAYLTDRVRVAAGEPQRYGTQVERWEGRTPIPFPIEDPDNVDARRSAMGMSTLEAYFDLFRRHMGYEEPATPVPTPPTEDD